MSCYTTLYYTILYYTRLDYTILYCAILCYTCTLQYYIVVYYTSTVLHYTTIALNNTIGAAAWQGWVESERAEGEGGAARKAAASEGGQLVADEDS